MIEKEEYNENELLREVAEGDERKFSFLFHHYKQLVYNVAWTYTEDEVSSEEILQDVFLIVWKKREKLPEVKNFTAWVYVIAKHRSLRVLKKMAGDPLHSAREISFIPAWEEDHTKQISEKQVQELLQQALAILSPQQRKVFELSRLAGFSREKVAEELGISKATVSVHLTIALRLVRAFLLSRLEIVIALLIFPEFFLK